MNCINYTFITFSIYDKSNKDMIAKFLFMGVADVRVPYKEVVNVLCPCLTVSTKVTSHLFGDIFYF